MFTNISYHEYFQGYLHINQYLGLFGEALDLVKYAALPHDSVAWFLLMDIPFFIGVCILYPSIHRLTMHLRFRRLVLITLCVLTWYVVQWNPVSEDATLFDLMGNEYTADEDVVDKYGLLAFNLVDLLKYQDAVSHIKSIEYGRRITGAGFNKNDTLQADSTTVPQEHPNFIIIQVESMDAYIVNCQYKKAYIMPFLHSLTNQSVYYPYTMSYHKAGSTSDCEFSTINSIEPFADYPSMKIRNYNYPNSMIKPLVAAGYDAAAFHGNRGTYFNRTSAFKKMGFPVFYDMALMGLAEDGWGVSDGKVLDYVSAKLTTQKKPYIYYIITMSSHEPFTIVGLYYKNNAYASIKDEAARNYFLSLSYVDNELKKFITHVRETQPNTYIILYGDHTPIIKKNLYRRASFFERSRIFEFVPMIILTPDGKSYLETKNVASFLDVAPTVLAASGVPYSYRSNGANLLIENGRMGTLGFYDMTYLRSYLYSKVARGDKGL
jgi:phosphoglycerol transferase MdoB-like AlkP superfamily enzyme